MPANDFMYVFFREILKFQEYPGTPFTGNAVQDVVQFFFLPMVIIVFFIYILLGRIGLSKPAWLRALMGLGVFAFMVIQGWFAAFGRSTIVYFTLLILTGIFYFVFGHFRRGDGGSQQTTQEKTNFPATQQQHPGREHRGDAVNLFERRHLQNELKDVIEDLRDAEGRLAIAIKSNSRDAEHWGQEVTRLKIEKRRFEESLKLIKW